MQGRRLGHFEILSLLGEGGMGAVYKARDTHLERMAAVKVLPHDKMSDPERRRRFSQEAKAASALNHPNIITIYDIASDGDVDFIAMEFVEGRTLEALLTWGPLRMADAVKYSRQMADALAAAHAAGILHRDLKPANVMIRVNGLVKLLDFGLAKLTDPGEVAESGDTRTMAMGLTQAGSVMGTVAYMSPEQAEGKKLDFRSDIFSLGLVMYEMVTGKRAFAGDSQASIIASLLRDEPRPIAELRPDVPQELSYLIAHCLCKEPDWRVQSMADLKTALDHLPEIPKSPSGSSVFPPGFQPQPPSQMYQGPPPPYQTVPPTFQTAPPQQQWPTMPPQQQAWPPAGPPPPPQQPWPTQAPSSHPYIPEPRKRKRFFRRFWWVFLLAFFLVQAFVHRVESIFERPVHEVTPPGNAILTATAFATGAGWARQPAFSKDGRQVAYSWNGSDKARAAVFNIYMRPAGGGDAHKVTSGTTEDFAPQWSPDGKTIAFLRLRKNVDEIILTPVAGDQKAVKVAEIAHRDGNTLAWTRDGRSLIFPDAPALNTPVGIYELTLSSGARRRLVKPSTGRDLYPTLSANGNLAFARQTSDTQSEIYTADMPDSDESDSDAQQITSLGTLSVHPVWTASGDQIVFTSGTAETVDLWRVTVSTKNPQRLAGVGDGGEDPAISPKGRRLVYSKKDSGLWLVDGFR